MIHKFKPELTLYLADEALKNTFGVEKVGLQEIMAIQKECIDYLSKENIRRIYARMMKIEITKMMVESVYQSLSSEEQEFIKLRYREKKQMVAISMRLNISLAQLNVRHHRLLEKTAEFMQYRLRKEDIFERGKIESMVKLLKKIIDFAEKYDPAGEFISKCWLEAIRERYDKYVSLLVKLNETLTSSASSLHKQIIGAKMKNPRRKIRDLAKICNVDKSIVSRNLKHFVDEVQQYIE